VTLFTGLSCSGSRPSLLCDLDNPGGGGGGGGGGLTPGGGGGASGSSSGGAVSDVMQYMCPLCHRQFSKESSLKNHIRLEHWTELY